eukprot:CAMPEP_0119336928 /NCGR_PEP_ID=MMETSP1333-20130426/92934_1 /TAXON_ID=418940 /ORGANISM="Scyphosphaera apsteinii, Strain RCC1455" /LENGTH=764 /DNA_ID=CAMNT_0007347863 /DNA_START=29 /DNA_END=2323 /DNA_ORIENTATION=-
MASLATVATCNLNQWAMDFKGNLERIKLSIREAKEKGCSFRTGPELEITGYGCEDYFHEHDTMLHSWESLVHILSDDITDGIICDIGMPVMHRNVLYNCRVVCLNRRILGIRPKFCLANDGNYREMRYFTPWYFNPESPGYGELQEHYLPSIVQDVTHQKKVPIGIFSLATLDTCLSFETCEELFTPRSPHILLSLDGIEIMANGSGSYHQLRKLNKRIDLLKGATAKAGGIYLYANQKGNDGGRVYYDGCAMVYVNGACVAQGSQFLGFDEVEVVVATVSLSDVRSFRANNIARSYQASAAPTIPRIDVDFRLCDGRGIDACPSPTFEPKVHSAMEEIAYGPSGWLWDYLRRSGMRGYFLPLSGGADSSSTATLVAIMCQRAVAELTSGTERSKKQTLGDIRKVTKRPDYVPTDWRDLCGKIFVTCYMASQYSGCETRERAELLASSIGAMHTSIFIDEITQAIKRTFASVEMHGPRAIPKEQLKSEPRMEGGTIGENLALQNIQARSRMVMAYFMAQLMPWATDGDQTTAGGSLLVLGSANVDEALRGYYTKYDCSAADINPIGGINKCDLKAFMVWAAEHKGIAVLQRVADAKPSAELTGAEGAQLDEEDMGMSYEELGDLGFCRKVEHCGPLSTFIKLRHRWADGRRISPSNRAMGAAAPQTRDEEIAQKVKDFYFYNAITRHKMTTLTPSYHAENYSPDDNRFDLRPFLQNPRFDLQFAAIDKAVKQLASCAKRSAPDMDGKGEPPIKRAASSKGAVKS